MNIRDQIFQLYQKFYAQRSILTNAPQLTIEIDRITDMSVFPENQAFEELSLMASYFIGRQDIRHIPFHDALRTVEKVYANQPFWHTLMMDYLEILLNKNEQALIQRGREIQEKAENVLDQIAENEMRQQILIDMYASKIEENHFAINGKKLMENYLKMVKKDPKKAWETLTTNPGYFSPIITKNPGGAQTLTPEQACAENKKIGRFLKDLKA